MFCLVLLNISLRLDLRKWGKKTNRFLVSKFSKIISEQSTWQKMEKKSQLTARFFRQK